MFEFSPDQDTPKLLLYAALTRAVQDLTADERDPVANMANIAALSWQFVPCLNWAGFYRAVGDELVLGPFMGKPACVRIAFGQGVCGTAAASGSTQIVPDVHDYPGHISCDADSRAELVVPVIGPLGLIAVIDLDSPEPGRFDEEDAAGMNILARLVAELI